MKQQKFKQIMINDANFLPVKEASAFASQSG